MDEKLQAMLNAVVRVDLQLSNTKHAMPSKPEHDSKNDQRDLEILAYARRISATTSAPSSNWQPGQPLFMHRAPAPQEDMMRATKLFRQQYQDSTDLNLQKSTDADQLYGQGMQQQTAMTGNIFQRAKADSDEAHDDLLLDLDLNPDLT